MSDFYTGPLTEAHCNAVDALFESPHARFERVHTAISTQFTAFDLFCYAIHHLRLTLMLLGDPAELHGPIVTLNAWLLNAHYRQPEALYAKVLETQLDMPTTPTNQDGPQ